MEIVWTRHARERFFERSLKHGTTTAEVEQNVKAQKVKEKQKDGKIKTIFKILGQHFTIIKEETKKYINIISMWEANEKEAELWKRKA